MKGTNSFGRFGIFLSSLSLAPSSFFRDARVALVINTIGMIGRTRIPATRSTSGARHRIRYSPTQVLFTLPKECFMSSMLVSICNVDIMVGSTNHSFLLIMLQFVSRALWLIHRGVGDIALFSLSFPLFGLFCME